MHTSATTWKQKQFTPPKTHSHHFQLFHDNNRQQYKYVHHYSIKLIAFSAEYTLLNNCNFNLVYRYYLSVKFISVYYRVMVTRYCSYSCFVLLKMGDSKIRNMLSSSQTKIKSVTCESCRDLHTINTSTFLCKFVSQIFFVSLNI
jgi:hypothetical protein